MFQNGQSCEHLLEVFPDISYHVDDRFWLVIAQGIGQLAADLAIYHNPLHASG